MPADAESVAAARGQLARDGVTVLPAVLDDGWCRRLRAAIERCRAAPSAHYGVLSPAGAARVDSDLFRWGDDPDVHALTHASPLVDWACALLAEDAVVLVEDQWFASEPGATTPSPWHQDQPYYRVDRPFLTIWVTLDDIDEDGSLRVVPGSHLGPMYAPVEFAASTTTVGAGSALPSPPRRDEDVVGDVRAWSLRAGDGIALDSRALHATGPGALPAAFRRVSTRWAPAGTRYVERAAGTAAFWDIVDHGLRDGDALASRAFPLVSSRAGNSPDLPGSRSAPNVDVVKVSPRA